MTAARRWYFNKRPKDDIEADTLMLRDETLAPLRDGEFLLRSIYLSMDATNRLWLGDLDLYMEPVQLGNPMIGFIAAEIVESRHPDFPVGSFAAGILPWSDFIISDGSGMQLLPNIPGLNMADRSEEHTSELQSLMRISYDVFCLKKKNTTIHTQSLTIKLHNP